MTSRDFCFWLQGHFELHGACSLTNDQTKLIQQHLALVFKHEIDPSMGDEKHQTELNEIHGYQPTQLELDAMSDYQSGDSTLMRC